MSERTLNLIKDNDIRWVDLRFTDTRGKEQHVSIPASQVDEDFFEDGKMFDGSSIAGWKGINESDMILMPDDSTSIIDPFTDDATSFCVATSSSLRQCKAMSAIHAALQSAPRPTSHRLVWVTQRSSVRTRVLRFRRC